MKFYLFRTVSLSIIRSFSLYTQQWCMSCRFADSLQAGSGCNWVPSWSCSQVFSKPVWHIPLLCVQWKTPDNGQRDCPKYVEFHSKNKFEKSVELVGFIVGNLSWCTVTWTSNTLQYRIMAVYSGIVSVSIHRKFYAQKYTFPTTVWLYHVFITGHLTFILPSYQYLFE